MGLEQRLDGEDRGVPVVLGGLLGGGAKTDAILNDPAVRMLTRIRKSVRSHWDSTRALKEAPRHQYKKKKGHDELRAAMSLANGRPC